MRRTKETLIQPHKQEVKRFTDTITTDRFEMQTEIDKILQKNKSMNAFLNSGYSVTGFTINDGVAQASNTSQEDSIRNAMTRVKEITLQAQDRVISKVKRERIQKVLDEFEENNKHGFDNRKGDKHVVGVYRWIDKLYKNQIYNYGKRMMFEFMIPEPGRLHTVAMTSEEEVVISTLQKPLDPRTESHLPILNAGEITPSRAQFWAAKYNANIPVLKDSQIFVSADRIYLHTSG